MDTDDQSCDDDVSHEYNDDAVEVYGAFCTEDLRKEGTSHNGCKSAETKQFALTLVDKMKNEVSMNENLCSGSDSETRDDDSYFSSLMNYKSHEVDDNSESRDIHSERRRLHKEIRQNLDHLPDGTLFRIYIKSQDAAAKSSGKATVASKLMERWLPLAEDVCMSRGVIGVADMPSKMAAKYNQFPFSSAGDFMKCPHCDDRVFKYHRDLVRHVMQTHYPFVLRWVCTICNMPDSTAFKRKSDLLIHYRRNHHEVHTPEKSQASSYTVSYNNQYIPPMKVSSGQTPFPFAEEVLEDALHLMAWQTNETPIPPLPSEKPCEKLGPFSIFGLDYGDSSDGVKAKKNHNSDERNLSFQKDIVFGDSISENPKQKLSLTAKRKGNSAAEGEGLETTSKRLQLEAFNGGQSVAKKFKIVSNDFEKKKGKRKKENPRRHVSNVNGTMLDTVTPDPIDLTGHLSPEEMGAVEYEETVCNSHDAAQCRSPELTCTNDSINTWQQAIQAIEQSTSQLEVPSTQKEMDGAIKSQRCKIDVLEKASLQFQNLLTKARASEAEMVQRSCEMRYEQRIRQMKATHAMEIADLHDVIKKLTDENETLKSPSSTNIDHKHDGQSQSSSQLKKDNINLTSKISTLELESDLYFEAFIKSAAILPKLSKEEAVPHAKTLARDLGLKLTSSKRTLERFGDNRPVEFILQALKQEEQQHHWNDSQAKP